MTITPTKMTYPELAALLRHMANRVEAGDSYEGHIEYLIDYESETPEDVVAVSGAFRIGNLQGQGGMRIIGNPYVESDALHAEPPAEGMVWVAGHWRHKQDKEEG